MEILQAVVLGVLQGILEWLPVSSEGILTLVSINLLKMPISEAIKFSIWLHLGTFFSVLFYFRKDILDLLKHSPKYLKNIKSDDPKSKTITFLILSTLFTGVVGLPIFLFSTRILGLLSLEIVTFLIGCFLIITGLLQKKSKEGVKNIKKLQNKDGILIGILQGFSALPGISRSGITTSGLLFKKFNSETALKLSFLMSIPTILVAQIGLGVLDGVSLTTQSLISVLFAFIFGLLSISVLFKLARKVKFWKFCVVLGLIAMVPLILTSAFGKSSQTHEEIILQIGGDRFFVEVADDPGERSQGLMYREQLDRDKGMLFVFDEDALHYMWMKNTRIPLDMVWISGDQEVVHIEKNIQPCFSDQCPLVKPDSKAWYVLELNAGISDEIGLKEGDKVDFEL